MARKYKTMTNKQALLRRWILLEGIATVVQPELRLRPTYLRADLWLPETKTLIEIQGVGHSRAFGLPRYLKQTRNDKLKRKWAREHGRRLLEIMIGCYNLGLVKKLFKETLRVLKDDVEFERGAVFWNNSEGKAKFRVMSDDGGMEDDEGRDNQRSGNPDAEETAFGTGKKQAPATMGPVVLRTNVRT